MTLTQEEIENIILKYIEVKHCEKMADIAKKLDEIHKERELLNLAYEKFRNFEEKHKAELEEIFIIPTRQFREYGILNTYLFNAYNSISNEFECLEMQEDKIKNDKFCPEDLVQFTYADFEKDLGIGSETIKKYTNLLERKGKILKKKGLGGFFYKIL